MGKKGQITVEMVLILAILLFIGYTVRSNFMDKHRLFSAFILTPWEQIGGMMESGVWGKRNQVRSKHPNQFSRMYTVQPGP